MSGSKTFLGINITLFLENKYIFEENLYCALFGNTFQWKLYHVKTSKLKLIDRY